MDSAVSPVAGFLLLLGLSIFFGVAFEEFHAQGGQARPGGVRSFPLLALSGALLYRLDSEHLLPLHRGLVGWNRRRQLASAAAHFAIEPSHSLVSSNGNTTPGS